MYNSSQIPKDNTILKSGQTFETAYKQCHFVTVYIVYYCPLICKIKVLL